MAPSLLGVEDFAHKELFLSFLILHKQEEGSVEFHDYRRCRPRLREGCLLVHVLGRIHCHTFLAHFHSGFMHSLGRNKSRLNSGREQTSWPENKSGSVPSQPIMANQGQGGRLLPWPMADGGKLAPVPKKLLQDLNSQSHPRRPDA